MDEGKVSVTDRHDVADALSLALTRMKDFKPNDRSDVDRRVAISVTDLEKLVAYWDHWIVLQPE